MSEFIYFCCFPFKVQLPHGQQMVVKERCVPKDISVPREQQLRSPVR